MLAQRVKKLILIRLLCASLLLYTPHSIFTSSAVTAFMIYLALILICALSVFYILWYLTKRRLEVLARFQIGFDVFLISFLLYFAGGSESVLAIFYPLSILAAALILGTRRDVLQVTVLSCVAYLTASFLSYRAATGGFFERDPIYFFYSVSVRMFLFFLVGRLSEYLSQNIRELEERLKLSERLVLLGEVLSKVAHEIRNPLSAIRTAAEVLKDSLPARVGPEETRMAEIVFTESNRLTQTLERILGYARSVPPKPRMLPLDGMVERTLAIVKLRADLHPEGITVEKQYNPVATHLYADEEQVLGALLNLTLNAYQAMPKGGVFRITAAENLKGTRVELADSGPGIPPEKIKDLFLPFKSNKKGGTGLGLAEVQKIVALHQGKIDVVSRPGKGTAFHLFFPKP